MAVLIGVDVGQRAEPSALCVVEIEDRSGPHGTQVHYVVRHLERFPIGTEYPALADRVAQVASGASMRGAHGLHVYLDATELGEPVVELFSVRVREAPVVAVSFIHRDRRHAIRHDEVQLGKVFLVARLQALLQVGCLHLPRTAEAERLAADLLEFEIQVAEEPNERYRAVKLGPREELVMALGLASQPRPPRGFAVHLR